MGNGEDGVKTCSAPDVPLSCSAASLSPSGGDACTVPAAGNTETPRSAGLCPVDRGPAGLVLESPPDQEAGRRLPGPADRREGGRCQGCRPDWGGVWEWGGAPGPFLKALMCRISWRPRVPEGLCLRLRPPGPSHLPAPPSPCLCVHLSSSAHLWPWGPERPRRSYQWQELL